MKCNDNNNTQFCALLSAPTPQPGGLFNFQTGNIWFENRGGQEGEGSEVKLYRPARTIRLGRGSTGGWTNQSNEWTQLTFLAGTNSLTQTYNHQSPVLRQNIDKKNSFYILLFNLFKMITRKRKWILIKQTRQAMRGLYLKSFQKFI